MCDYSFYIPEPEHDQQYDMELFELTCRRMRSYERKLGRKLSDREYQRVAASADRELSAVSVMDMPSNRYLQMMQSGKTWGCWYGPIPF